MNEVEAMAITTEMAQYTVEHVIAMAVGKLPDVEAAEKHLNESTACLYRRNPEVDWGGLMSFAWERSLVSWSRHRAQNTLWYRGISKAS